MYRRLLQKIIKKKQKIFFCKPAQICNLQKNLISMPSKINYKSNKSVMRLHPYTLDALLANKLLEFTGFQIFSFCDRFNYKFKQKKKQIRLGKNNIISEKSKVLETIELRRFQFEICTVFNTTGFGSHAFYSSKTFCLGNTLLLYH